MNICPQDLSPQIRAQVLRAKQLIRTSKYLGTPVNAEQYDLPEESSRDYSLAAAGVVGLVLGIAADLLSRMTVSWPALSLLGGAGIVIGTALGYAARERAIHQRNRERITLVEISLVCGREADALKQDYLSVVRDLMTLPPLPDGTAVPSIRNSLRLLGEAIEGLPPVPADGLFLDPSVLQHEAHTITEAARRETDAVVAASLRRQEAALERRAETISQTAVLVRRNHALRAEVTAQVRAIQTSIAAGRMNGRQVGSEFAALADHVALMAQEATALSDAQAELDTALAGVEDCAAPPVTRRSLPETVTIQTLRNREL